MVMLTKVIRGFGRHEDSNIRGKGLDLPLFLRFIIRLSPVVIEGVHLSLGRSELPNLPVPVSQVRRLAQTLNRKPLWQNSLDPHVHPLPSPHPLLRVDNGGVGEILDEDESVDSIVQPDIDC